MNRITKGPKKNTISLSIHRILISLKQMVIIRDSRDNMKPISSGSRENYA